VRRLAGNCLDAEPVARLALGCIERLIGPGEQILGCRALFTAVQGNSDAGGDAQGLDFRAGRKKSTPAWREGCPTDVICTMISSWTPAIARRGGVESFRLISALSC
jgi:hypothetical protein